METAAIASGVSEALALPAGVWSMEITGVWDGATAALLESGGSSTFTASDDPYNTGNALTRTADGKTLHCSGGKSFKISLSGAGASTSLRLVARRAE